MPTSEFIPQMKPLFGEEERKKINEYFEEEGFITEFKRTAEFESVIANYTGAKHCIVVNNGTISLTLAAIALGIGPGDEIIVPNYTMIATPNSVKMLGATPVFIDVELDTLALDIELVKKNITSRTKAIILVTPNGREPSAGITEFEKISELTGIPIIEDAAQSLGSLYKDGRHVGRAGKLGSFSFSAPKIISTGQGGALITDDDLMAEKIKKLKDFGRGTGGADVHDIVGFNCKFTELQACVGLAQMEKLPQRVLRKKEIWKNYSLHLSSIPEVKIFRHDIDNCTPWFIDILCNDRSGLVEFLKTKNIGTRTMYPRITHQEAYKLGGDYPVTKVVEERGLWLPSMVQLSDDQIKYVTDSISEFYCK